MVKQEIVNRSYAFLAIFVGEPRIENCRHTIGRETAQLMVLIDAADRGFLNDTTRAAPLGDTSLDLSQQFFLLPLGLKS